MRGEYRRIDVGGRAVYVRSSGVEALEEVSVVLFDCDGVLIDARQSYNRAIERTVSYLAGDVIRVALPERSVTDEVIYAFRKSGGFNNDWDTTYAILLYIFTNLPEALLDRFRDAYRRLSGDRPVDPYDRVSRFREVFSDVERVTLSGVREDLLELAKRIDSRGLVSVEELLVKGCSGEALEGFRALMSYPGKVGVSVLMTVFEELFLGPRLFYSKYHLKPRFVQEGRGLIDHERPLVTVNTLKALSGILGESSIGIVSGRSRLSSEYTLKGLVKWFNPEITVFIEDEIEAALEAGDEGGAFKMGKPNPYGLLEAEKNAARDGRIVYVGDSKEDTIMVEEANRAVDRFISAGVYGSSNSPEDLAELFFDDGAYIIAESVNDIPQTLKGVKEGKI